MLVPAVDEISDPDIEILDEGEESSADGSVVDDGEEILDHVEPGGTGRERGGCGCGGRPPTSRAPGGLWVANCRSPGAACHQGTRNPAQASSSVPR